MTSDVSSNKVLNQTLPPALHGAKNIKVTLCKESEKHFGTFQWITLGKRAVGRETPGEASAVMRSGDARTI